jgi:hypothetical protein
MNAGKTEIVWEGTRLTEITYDAKGRPVRFVPLSWPNIRSYLQWTLDNWERLPNRFSTPEVEVTCRMMIRAALDHFSAEEAA